MIRLMYQSYMDKKKYMILFIYQFVLISILVIMCYEEDSVFEMKLNKAYYQVYYEQLFMQVFMILNAMFVLFLAMDHDQSFLKPYYAFFRRQKVIVSKYIFHACWIVIYALNLYMLKTIIFDVFIPIEITFDKIALIDLALDMFLILNLIFILMRSKYRSLSVIIVLCYILLSLFITNEHRIFDYIFPIYKLDKSINLLELSYKICYIYLGFLIYNLKSLAEDV